MPGSSSVDRSLRLCTAMSISFARSARSISFVKNARPDRPQRHVRAHVTLCLDVHQLQRRAARLLADQLRYTVGLPEGQCRGARADAQRAHVLPFRAGSGIPRPTPSGNAAASAGSCSNRLRNFRMKLSTVRVEGNTS